MTLPSPRMSWIKFSAGAVEVHDFSGQTPAASGQGDEHGVNGKHDLRR